MNAYQKEHLEAYRIVTRYLASRPAAERHKLRELTAAYVDFRKRLDAYQQRHLAEFCSRKCYQSRLSACCSRDSIVVYFADVVVNCLSTANGEVERIMADLERPNRGHHCIYLTPSGCRWRVSPIVCAMFLCDEAEAHILGLSAEGAVLWRQLVEERKLYTWPDRPVVFDALERRFLEANLSSALMHLNTSPGLLALKRRAGLWIPDAPVRNHLKG